MASETSRILGSSSAYGVGMPRTTVINGQVYYVDNSGTVVGMAGGSGGGGRNRVSSEGGGSGGNQSQSQSNWTSDKLYKNWVAYGKYLAFNKFGIPANSPNQEQYVRALAKQMGIKDADTMSLDRIYFSIGGAVHDKVFQGWGQAGEIDNPDKFISWMNQMESDTGEKGQQLRNIISTYENSWKGVAQSMYTNEMEGLESDFQKRMKDIYQGGYKDYVDQARLELEQRSIGLQEKANALGLFKTLGALEARKQMGDKLSSTGEAILNSNINSQQQAIQSIYDQARIAALQKEYATAKQASLGALQQQFQTQAQIIGTNLNIDLSKIEGLRSMFNFSLQQEQLNAEKEAAQRQMEEAKRQAEASVWGSLAGLAGTIIGGVGGGLLLGPAGAGIGASVGGSLGAGISSLFLGPTAMYGGQKTTQGLAPSFGNWKWKGLLEKQEK